MHTSQSIEQFLRAFEHTGSRGEVSRLASCFAETFMAAGPEGARVVRAADFALALPKRQKMFDAWGWRSTKLASIKVTEVNRRYAIAETMWQMSFACGEGQWIDVLVGSTFLVDTEGEFRILFYLSHQDIASELRERGVVQA